MAVQIGALRVERFQCSSADERQLRSLLSLFDFDTSLMFTLLMWFLWLVLLFSVLFFLGDEVWGSFSDVSLCLGDLT